jgi:hypothetical protein
MQTLPTPFRGRVSYGGCKLHAETCVNQLRKFVDIFILRWQGQKALAPLGPIERAVL